MIRSIKVRLSWLKQSQYQKLFQEDIYENVSIPHYYEHPDSIYQCPLNGISYFLKKNNLKQCLFPRRTGYLKNFTWKKNNFTTKFPKNNPIVQYLTATTTNKQFKMICVKYLKQECNLIFCLIRRNQNSVNFKENVIDTYTKQNCNIVSIQKPYQNQACHKDNQTENQKCFVHEFLKEIYQNQNSKFFTTIESSETIMPL